MRNQSNYSLAGRVAVAGLICLGDERHRTVLGELDRVLGGGAARGNGQQEERAQPGFSHDLVEILVLA